MKIIKNEKLIKRNGTIGSYASLIGIVMVGIPFIYYTQALLQKHPEKLNNATFVTLLMALMFTGLIASQVGSYMSNKFGPSPRPDEKLDSALKGLPNEFVMYHYTTPASHLLIGPAGVWVLLPYHQGGRVTFEKKRWRNSGGGFIQSYMRFFGQGLGRPDIEVEGEVQSLNKYLSKKMDESEIPEINVLMVFTNDNVELDAENAPIPAMKLKQIKEFMRQKAKEKKLPPERLSQLKTVFE
jgi:hypothetical protein